MTIARTRLHPLIALLVSAGMGCSATGLSTGSPRGGMDAASDVVTHDASLDTVPAVDLGTATDVEDTASIPPGPAAPRLVAPLSTARVTRSAPTLRWQLAPGSDGAIIDLCTDRACMSGPMMSVRAHGSSVQVPSPLASGMYFWRARGTAGSSEGTENSPTWEFRAPRIDGVADTSFDSIPDWNGDGIADLAVGVGRENDDSGGVVNVYLSHAGRLPSTPSTSFAAPNFSTLANAGDVDGDGFADLAVRIIGGGSPERIDLHMGGPMGPSPVARYAITWRGGNEFGRVVVAVGDVNGDGYADLAAQSPHGGYLGGFGQRIEIYHGGARGPGATPDAYFDGGSEYTGMGPPAPLGDINGDGYADLAASDSSGTVTGDVIPAFVRVFRGSPTGIDTHSPTRIASPATGDQGFGILLDRPVDLNADGFADLVVGASDPYQDAGMFPPRVYAYGGSAGATATTPSVVCTLSGLIYNGSGGTSAGDIDGDGYDDLLFATDATAPTVVQVVRGAAGWLPPIPSSSITRTGAAGDDLRLTTSRDLDGDGVEDLVGSIATSSGPSGLATSFGFVVIRGRRGALPDPAMAVIVMVPMTTAQYTFEVVAMMRRKSALTDT